MFHIIKRILISDKVMAPGHVALNFCKLSHKLDNLEDVLAEQVPLHWPLYKPHFILGEYVSSLHTSYKHYTAGLAQLNFDYNSAFQSAN